MIDKPLSPAETPILNAPHDPPTCYWQLDVDNVATSELKAGRRPSSGQAAIPNAAVSAGPDREPFRTINAVRGHVEAWRAGGWKGTSTATRRLLEHWQGEESQPRPFFCQREAVETAIWLCEAGSKLQSPEWREVEMVLRSANREHNDGLPRIALKLATGTGKTVVMAMLMVWHAVNDDLPKDFVVITPGLTVKDRLRELHPSDSGDLLRGLTPRRLQAKISRLRVTVINAQALQPRDTLGDGLGGAPSGDIKKLLGRGEDPLRQEYADVFREKLPAHRGARRIVVLNDEAHHCYQPPEARNLSPEEKEDRPLATRWFSALQALRDEGRLDQVFDLSATPMFLRTPKGKQAPIFPWTVSDYPLSDAVEAGLTKIPRVPVLDDSLSPDRPVFRHVYDYASPKRLDGDNMQQVVADLLHQLHDQYRDSVAPVYEGEGIKPAMIVVADDITNAEHLYRWIAGYQNAEGEWIPGNLPIFSNVGADGAGYVETPPTLLVHSKITEGGSDALSGSLRRIALDQSVLHAPDAKTVKDKTATLREVFRTVGQAGKPGADVRCIISVSMLSEGWDAKTVTHIFGFRAFRSALLCEQVTGRALRRTSYNPDPETSLPRPEYANVFGVPYEFMPAQEQPEPPLPPRPTYKVFPVPGRRALRVRFPNVAGYCWSEPPPRCRIKPEAVEPYEVTASAQPTQTMIQPSVGQPDMIYNRRRAQEAIFLTAAAALEQFAEGDKRRRALFGDMVGAVEQWLAHPKVACDDPVRLLHDPHKNAVPMAIADACVSSGPHPAVRLPIFADVRDPSQARVLDTGIEGFETSVEPKHETERSELNIAPCDSVLEKETAEALDAHPRIEAWARNFRLDWQIPWFDKERGLWREYRPDFVARVAGEPELHLIIECKAPLYEGAESEAKREAVERMWIPAIEGLDGAFGQWRYCYIPQDDDPAAAITAAINGFKREIEAGAEDA